eukprot:5392899-Pyramimonas_sp.AAC.1
MEPVAEPQATTVPWLHIHVVSMVVSICNTNLSQLFVILLLLVPDRRALLCILSFRQNQT